MYSKKSHSDNNVPMDLFVKMVTGQTMVMMVYPSDTIMQIKKKIEDREGVDASVLRLLYGGKQLEDERTIFDYGIKKESTLFLIVRLKEVVEETPSRSSMGVMDIYRLTPESLSKQYYLRVQNAVVTTVPVLVSPLRPVFRFLYYLWNTIFYPPLRLLYNALIKVRNWIDAVVVENCIKVVKFGYNSIYNFLRPLVLTIKGTIRDSFSGLYKLLNFLVETLDKALIQPFWNLTKAIWNHVVVAWKHGLVPLWKLTVVPVLKGVTRHLGLGMSWLYGHTVHYLFKGIGVITYDYIWGSIKYVGSSIDRFSTWLDLDGKAVALFKFIWRGISNTSSWVYRNLLKPVGIDPAYWVLTKTGNAISYTSTLIRTAAVWSAKQTYCYGYECLVLPFFRPGPLFKLIEQIGDGYLYPWLFHPTHRIIIQYYTVMYEKVKKWFVWGLETNKFVAGVSPGKVWATRTNDMIVVMPHNTSYGIRIFNGHIYPYYCKITIDEEIDVGTFWCNPNYAFKIERCASSHLKFLFMKEPQQSANSISQAKIDSKLDEVFEQLYERNKGVITIQWLAPNTYPYNGDAPAQQQSYVSTCEMKSCMERTKMASGADSSNNNNNHTEDDSEGGAFGLGSTVLSGHSNQHMQRLQHHQQQLTEITTQKIYLIAPLDKEDKEKTE